MVNYKRLCFFFFLKIFTWPFLIQDDYGLVLFVIIYDRRSIKIIF